MQSKSDMYHLAVLPCQGGLITLAIWKDMREHKRWDTVKTSAACCGFDASNKLVRTGWSATRIQLLAI